MTQQNELQRLQDLADIRSLLDEYCLRLEVDDFEDWLNLFTPDAVYHVFRRDLNGHDEIRAMLSQAPHGVHMPGALRIELNGDTAETVQNYQFLGEDPATNNCGWYFRTVIRTADGWKISYAKVKLQKTKAG